MSLRPVKEATGSGHSLRSLICRSDSSGGLGQTGETILYKYDDLDERLVHTELLNR